MITELYGELSNSIEDILPKEMIWVAENPEYGEAYIVARKLDEGKNIDDFTVLEGAEQLNQAQLKYISNLIQDRHSYDENLHAYRLPPMPTFAIRLFRENQFLDVMMDISNPSWCFFHSSELYTWSFNSIKAEVQNLRHQLFRFAQFVLLRNSLKRYLVQN